MQALCPGLVRTEIHEPMKSEGFSPSAFPNEMWMEASEVVCASLDALAQDKLIVVPGEDNLALAKMGAKGLLDALG